MTTSTAAVQTDANLIPLHTAKAKSGKKRIALTIAAAAAIIAGAGFGYHWWTESRFLQTTDDAYVGGNVTVMGPKVAGYITNVAVTDNQLVHAGDLLIKIDDRDYQAALAKAEGAVAAQQALLANLEATRSLQNAVIQQAQAGVSASDADTLRARDDQTRYQNLSSRAAVSVQSSQKADADFKQAVANGQRSQAGLVAAQRQIDVIGAQKMQAQAALAQAVAERDIAKLNLAYTEIRAPIDGVIGNRRARNGAYATPGSQLLSIVPASGLWVDANFKEGQLTRMQPGQRATIEADVLPGKVLHGTVASLAPATGAQFSVLPPENATGNFTKIVQRVPVRIILDAEDSRLGTLRPGLSVVAEVDVRSEKHADSKQALAN
ncbi:HlyD family secretion protein [Undibacterium terreum]|uniref:Secretion protein HlyD n=1 Tax=Undibacterium terreum TaxID=1224302 RepID=A0A916U6L3_9BURK|nr:HlyD family secretion protein [Undibacterium terreum]GGC60573.1 secretion protein HlyD [Undibacterium terreum]